MPTQIVDYRQGITIVSPVYLDSNLLIYSLTPARPEHAIAKIILHELFRQQIEMYISTLAVDEIWWGLLGEKYFSETNQKLTSKKIKKNPNIIAQYSGWLQNIFSNVTNWPNTTFLPTPAIGARDTIDLALGFLTQQNAQPRDSFHLALVSLSTAAGFITSDSDFDSISFPGRHLTIYKF